MNREPLVEDTQNNALYIVDTVHAPLLAEKIAWYMK
jgi:hypothetical protein